MSEARFCVVEKKDDNLELYYILCIVLENNMLEPIKFYKTFSLVHDELQLLLYGKDYFFAPGTVNQNNILGYKPMDVELKVLGVIESTPKNPLTNG